MLASPFRIGFAAASHLGWCTITGCGLLVLTVGLLTTGRRARQTAARTADKLTFEDAPRKGHSLTRASSLSLLRTR